MGKAQKDLRLKTRKKNKVCVADAGGVHLEDMLPLSRPLRAVGGEGRRCTQRDCKFVPLNRDRNGATNIGTNFQRLFENKAPIRSLSEEDLMFHRATLCLECSD